MWTFLIVPFRNNLTIWPSSNLFVHRDCFVTSLLIGHRWLTFSDDCSVVLDFYEKTKIATSANNVVGVNCACNMQHKNLNNFSRKLLNTMADKLKSVTVKHILLCVWSAAVWEAVTVYNNIVIVVNVALSHYTEGIIYWWSISLMCYAALSAMRLNNEFAVSVFTTNFGKCRPILATFFVSCLRILSSKGCWDWNFIGCMSNIPWESLKCSVHHLHPEIHDRFLKLIFRSVVTLCRARQAGYCAKSPGLYAMPFGAHMT